MQTLIKLYYYTKELLNCCSLVRRKDNTSSVDFDAFTFSSLYCLTGLVFFGKCLPCTQGTTSFSISHSFTPAQNKDKNPHEQNFPFSWILCLGPPVTKSPVAASPKWRFSYLYLFKNMKIRFSSKPYPPKPKPNCFKIENKIMFLLSSHIISRVFFIHPSNLVVFLTKCGKVLGLSYQDTCDSKVCDRSFKF